MLYMDEQVSKYTQLLDQQINKVDSLLNDQQITESPEFKEWETITKNLTRRIFGDKSAELKQIATISYYANNFYVTPIDKHNEYKNGLIEAKAILKGHKQQLLDLGLPQDKPLIQRMANQINIHNNQNQNNQQSQNVTQNNEQKVDFGRIIKQIKSEWGDEEQVKKAEVVLGELETELKKSNPTWSVLKKGLEQVFSFGKGIAIEVMAEVVKKLYLP